MIIKSMSRKEPTYGKLIAYLSRDASDARYELRHNVFGQDVASLIAEFEENGRLLPKRKNGVTMYHEIISITRPRKLDAESQKAILRDIALDYICLRAPQSLAFGCLHDDHADHLHYHFIVSANPLGETRRHRLTKEQFRKLQIGLEGKVRALYPQLEQDTSIAKRARPRQLNQAGFELKRRTGSTPKRDQLKARVAAIFAASATKTDLLHRLRAEQLAIYQRGNAVGIRDLTTGRNHRIATLGLEPELDTMVARFDAPQVAPQAHQAPIVQKEARMNFLEAALQGLSAALDIASISRDTGKQLDGTSAHVNRIVTRTEHATGSRQAATAAATPAAIPPMTEAERIAAERAQEISDLRDEQERQNARQSSHQTRR